MVKTLVTGSSGFLGKHVMHLLGMDGVPYDIADGKDILDAGQLKESLEGCGRVIHLAAVADLYEAEASQSRTFELNVMGTEVVARVCAQLKIQLVFASTCCAYGNNQPATVDTALAPTENYAASKAAAEYVVRQYGGPFRIDRLPTLYGPGMREALFIYRVIDAVYNGRPVKLDGDGVASRQYGYVQDVAYSLLDPGENWNRLPVRNLNGPEAISNIKVVADVCRILNRAVTVVFSEDRKSQIYGQQIRSDLDHPMEWLEGLKKTIDWYREQVALKAGA